MSRRWYLSSLAAVVGTAAFLVGCVPSAAAAPPTCERFDELPAQPSAVGGLQDELIATANELADEGQLNAADRLYELGLRRQPTDARATEGLRYDRARRLLADEVLAVAQRLNSERYENRTATSAEAESAAIDVDECFEQALRLNADNEDAQAGPKPPAERLAASRAADRWDTFYKSWVDPTVRLILPTLAVFAVLLVLTRLMTASVVPPGARAWPDVPRWLAAASGFGLLLVASLRLTALAVSPDKIPEGASAGGVLPSEARLLVVPAILVLAAVAWWLAGRPDWSSLKVRVVASSVLAAAVIVGAIAYGIGDKAWAVLLSLLLAALGVVLLAAGRGHVLRLMVEVRKGDANDAAAAAYVVARLDELGSTPPRGLKTPMQVDVTGLPVEALSSLPAGRLAAALTSMLNVLRPAVPWRVVVADCDGTVVVTVTRNGSLAEKALIDPARFVPPPSKDEGSDAVPAATPVIGRADLLTAAAAVALTRLAQVHRSLAIGLCGAREWASVAAHVVATRPGFPDGVLKRELLAFAVNRDPQNGLAYATYVMALGEARGDGVTAANARRLNLLATQIDQQRSAADEDLRSGYSALCLRIAHARAAAWLNLAVGCDGTTDGGRTYREQAQLAISDLERRLRDRRLCTQRHLDDFVHDMARIAEHLRDALDLVSRRLPTDPQSSTPIAAPFVPADGGRERLDVMYAETCTLALASADDPVVLRRMLRTLELVTGQERLRARARTDPAFLTVRTRPSGSSTSACDAWQGYWRLVEEPLPEFTELTVFGNHGSALRTLGLMTPDALRPVVSEDAADDLAERLQVPRSVVDRWAGPVRLAAPRGALPTDRLETRELMLLLSAEVSSPEVLKEQFGNDKSGLRKLLDKQARSLHLRGLDDREFERVWGRRNL